MNKDRDQNADHSKQHTQSEQNQEPRSSPFNEKGQGDEKSTTNAEQEADLEQQRKEALTERD